MSQLELQETSLKWSLPIQVWLTHLMTGTPLLQLNQQTIRASEE